MNQDLTTGKESSVLVKYTLPMFVGVAFQQIYNIADSIIAGKFAGEDALAAVGASYAITMLFMAVAVGSQIGCTVVVSRYFGAREYKRLKTAVSTILLSGLILSAVLTVFGIALSNTFMQLLKTPDNILADSNLYFKIYVGGFVFLFLYNVVTGIFNSLGDSIIPLIFLICSSVGNVLLDLLFVAVFEWGVAGVAWATFIAQSMAGIAAFIVLLFRLKRIPTKGAPIWFSTKLLIKVAHIAVPSILQQSFISIGNLFIQKLVNSYGSSVIAGYSAAIKLNTFAVTGFTTLGNGISGFTAQNMGAGSRERVRKGWILAMRMAVTVAAVFFVCYFIFGHFFLEFFMDKEASRKALSVGYDFLKIVAPFYFVVCIKLICDGVLRGSAQMRKFMIGTFADLILRVLLAFVFSAFYKEVGIWMSWPVGWCISAVISFVYCGRSVEKPVDTANR